MSGVAGEKMNLDVGTWKRFQSVEGADLVKPKTNRGKLGFHFPPMANPRMDI